jgi:hypothetical protein
LTTVLATCLAFALGAMGSAMTIYRFGQPPVGIDAAGPAAEPVLSAAQPTDDLPEPLLTPPSPPRRQQKPHRAAAATHGPRVKEVDLLQRAQAASSANDLPGALEALGEHARRFPRGWFAEERDALRVRCLADAGRTDEARRAASVFAKRFPRSVLLRHLPDSVNPVADS